MLGEITDSKTKAEKVSGISGSGSRKFGFKKKKELKKKRLKYV